MLKRIFRKEKTLESVLHKIEQKGPRKPKTYKQPNSWLVVGATAISTLAIASLGIYYFWDRLDQILPPAQEYQATATESQTYAPTSTLEQAIDGTSTPVLSPTETPAYTELSTPFPLLEQFSANVGSGVFAYATYSDGSSASSDEWLDLHHNQVQRIRKEEQPSGCDIAQYDSDFIWLTAGDAVGLLVNGVTIGQLDSPTNQHGYIVQYPVSTGDNLCVSSVPASGYTIIIGPDIYWHYDSYCYRGHC